jgi:C_GCAxxG_C_C family probable redox protein
MSQRSEKAVGVFGDGFNCSQAVLSTLGPELGLDRDMALKVAGALGAGMGRMGNVCGAVSGAFMVIGLKYSKTRDGQNEIRDKGYALVRQFAQEFETRNGSIVCKEIIGCDISTETGLNRAREARLFIDICPKMVQDAVEILEQMGVLE